MISHIDHENNKFLHVRGRKDNSRLFQNVRDIRYLSSHFNMTPYDGKQPFRPLLLQPQRPGQKAFQPAIKGICGGISVLRIIQNFFRGRNIERILSLHFLNHIIQIVFQDFPGNQFSVLPHAGIQALRNHFKKLCKPFPAHRITQAFLQKPPDDPFRRHSIEQLHKQQAAVHPGGLFSFLLKFRRIDHLVELHGFLWYLHQTILINKNVVQLIGAFQIFQFLRSRVIAAALLQRMLKGLHFHVRKQKHSFFHNIRLQDFIPNRYGQFILLHRFTVRNGQIVRHLPQLLQRPA